MAVLLEKLESATLSLMAKLQPARGLLLTPWPPYLLRAASLLPSPGLSAETPTSLSLVRLLPQVLEVAAVPGLMLLAQLLAQAPLLGTSPPEAPGRSPHTQGTVARGHAAAWPRPRESSSNTGTASLETARLHPHQHHRWSSPCVLLSLGAGKRPAGVHLLLAKDDLG